MVKGEPQLCTFLINHEYQETDTMVRKRNYLLGLKSKGKKQFVQI